MVLGFPGKYVRVHVVVTEEPFFTKRDISAYEVGGNEEFLKPI